jgi:hypothetical protein
MKKGPQGAGIQGGKQPKKFNFEVERSEIPQGGGSKFKRGAMRLPMQAAWGATGG